MNTKPHCKLIERLRARLRELRNANGANVTVTFALATVPMMGFVGAAVDYSHANSVRAAMQSATDATALMLSKEAVKLTAAQIQTKGNDYFKALFTRPEATNLLLNISYSNTDGSKVVVNASADVKTDFMQLMGFHKLKVVANSIARWGTTKMQVALALDVTGSMAWDSKMPALKTATKELLTTLQTAAVTNGDVRVAIVPFAKYVKVDPSNHNQTWLDWEDWDDDNGHDKSTTTCTTAKTGKSGKSKKKCTTSTTWVPDNHNTWNGCITDRDQDYDVKNTTPNPGTPATLFPAEQGNDCPAKMMGLTFDWTALKAKVDELQPDGMHQPAHRARLGLDGPDAGRSAQSAGQDRRHATGHHPVLGRLEHREPLVERPGQDRRASGAHVHQRESRWHHDLYRAGELRLLQGHEGLRLEARVLLRDHRRPDRDGVQRDRHQPDQAAPREIAVEHQPKPKPGLMAGFFRW